MNTVLLHVCIQLVISWPLKEQLRQLMKLKILLYEHVDYFNFVLKALQLIQCLHIIIINWLYIHTHIYILVDSAHNRYLISHINGRGVLPAW